MVSGGNHHGTSFICTIFEDKVYDELSHIIKNYSQPSDNLLGQGEDTEMHFFQQKQGERRCLRLPKNTQMNGEPGPEVNQHHLWITPTRRTHGPLEEKKLFLHLFQKMMQVNHEERIKP